MKLIKLDYKYKDQLIEMIEEWRKDQEVNHTNKSPWAIFKNDEHDFDKYYAELENDVTVGQIVKSSVYFLLDEERDRLCGAVNIRHFLSDALKDAGGHIGDGVRPSERRKGYATKMIELALQKCPELGINDVMITCSKSNEGSRKSIVKNGGVYSHDFLDEGEEEPEEIYWIKLDEKLKIKNYQTGEEFLKENGDYLKTNQYMSSFFFFDAPLIKESNLKDYALCVEEENKKLLAIKVGYYPLIVFGEKELAPYLVNYIYTNNLELTKFLGETSLCEAIKDAIRLIQGKKFFEHLAMEFMDCRKVNGDISFEVEKPTLDDLDEICECMVNFNKDCGLNDPIDREKYASRINDYRVIKIDGKIASMGYYHQSTDVSCHVSCVYTRYEYRGRNLARKVVTTMTNEILNKGYIASLNVDKNNPITNHLYRSIGYVPVFSQSEFDEEK